MSIAHFVHGQSGLRIYCDMEQETIIYYYPMPEQTAQKENRYAAKRHWFQDAALKTVRLDEQQEFHVLGCAIPPFYYRRRSWKGKQLSETMTAVLSNAYGMTDTWVHPAIAALLTTEYSSKWMPRENTVRTLVKHLLKEYAGEALARCGMVTVFLGRPGDTDLQMEMTWELLQPFLPRVNRMLIYYEELETGHHGQEETGVQENRETPVFRQKKDPAGSAALQALLGRRRYRAQEERENVSEGEPPAELKEYLEDYDWEYGLVPLLEPYRTGRMVGEEADQTGAGWQRPASQLLCGREKCGGIILDYAGSFRYPKLLPEGGIYVDVVSVGEKERRMRQKGLSIPYFSPLKYLDTMVKNSYDS